MLLIGFPLGLSRTGSQVAATAKQKFDELSVGLGERTAFEIEGSQTRSVGCQRCQPNGTHFEYFQPR